MGEHLVPVVAIDGPSGSGKGAISGLLATRLGWRRLDSGALYRLVALAGTRNKLALKGECAAEKWAEVAAKLDVVFEPLPGGEERVWLAGEDVSREIRTESCGSAASKVATFVAVRTALVGLQRGFRQPPGLVADGRDMGSMIFPDAAVKIFLTASPEERAQRRYKQLKDKGISVSLPALHAEIAERDRRDMSREVAPLRPAPDAQQVDTTTLSIEEVVDLVEHIAARAVGLQ